MKLNQNELKEKLSKEIDLCDWSMLAPLYRRDSVLIIDSKLDLAEVGVAISLDDAKSVTQWQNLQMIRRPTHEEVLEWEKNPLVKMATFLIIQPFVIIQINNFQ